MEPVVAISPTLRDAPMTKTTPTRTESATPDAFRALLQGIAVVAGLTHAAFCGLFFWAQVDALAYVNVGSVLCYGWVFWLARRGQVEQAWAATVLEVLGHAILAVTIIGWDTGFHYYILLVIPVAVISSIRPVMLKAATVLGVMLTYLVLDIVLRHRLPPKALPPIVIDGLHYFNVVGVMVILLFLAGYYYYLIEQAAETLRDMAATDPLTMLKNRRAITEVIRREESRVRRGHPHLSFILCDLDHFKAINDQHGHDAGDEVLRSVSRVLQACMRDVDFAARWGGEEFLAVLPDTNGEGAQIVAERIRTRIAALSIEATGKAPLQVTMTLGVATMGPQESAEQAIARADNALYEGKRKGRNQVVAA